MCVSSGQFNTRKTIGTEQYSPTKPATNYLETPFVDGQRIQVPKSNEFPKNGQKIMVWGGFSVKGLVGYHSFKKYYGWPLLRSNSSRSPHSQCQKAIRSTLAFAARQ